MSEWFEEWFNSPEYLNIYSHRSLNEADEFAKTLTDAFRFPESCKTLDLACGAGRHAIAFACLGHDVTAIDISQSLLDEAHRETAKQKLKINYLNADIRTFKSADKFHLVLNVFTSFGYSEKDEENFSVFRTAENNLKDGGSFVFDFLNENYVKKTLVPYSRNISGGTVFEQVREIKNNFVMKDIIIQSDGKINTFNERVKMYDSERLTAELENAGLTVESVWGDYKGGEFVKNYSPRFIAVCRKK